VYYNKDEDILLLNITGTKNCNDWITNIYVGFGYLQNTSRYIESKNILEQTKKKYNKNRVLITAHSLGAQIAVNIGTDEDIIITYNGFFVKNEKYRKNEINYRNKGDIVSLFSPRKNTVVLPRNEYILRPLKAHLVKSIDDDNIIIDEVVANILKNEKEQEEDKKEDEEEEDWEEDEKEEDGEYKEEDGEYKEEDGEYKEEDGEYKE
jgi:hypothetical protein